MLSLNTNFEKLEIKRMKGIDGSGKITQHQHYCFFLGSKVTLILD